MEELKGSGWSQILHPDDLQATMQQWQHSIETGEPFSCLHWYLRADRVYRWHLSRAQAMRDTAGNISMWIGSNTDIHEQKQKEEELRQANEDLQQFAYSASHDLQEPIRNVAVYSDIVAKRYHHVLDADGQQFLGFLTEGGRRLATLVNDLLTYTRAGVSEGNAAVAADSAAVLEQTLSSLSEALRQSGGKVTYDTLPTVSMSFTHLQQLFQNLISNALKYRADAPPEIHVPAIYQGASWRFSVRDNGIGIDHQYKEKIFGVFKRLHRDQKYSGTGIGLAIANAWLSGMEDGSGSNPQSGKAPPSTSPSPNTPDGRPRRPLNLLLAEDNLPDALLLREAIRLEELPVELFVVPDGECAVNFIETAEQQDDAPFPHLALLDLNLPKVDGLDVLRRIRASQKYQNIPVLVVTSSDSPSDRSGTEKLGAGYFRKPVSYNEFLKVGPVLRQFLVAKGLL